MVSIATKLACKPQLEDAKLVTSVPREAQHREALLRPPPRNSTARPLSTAPLAQDSRLYVLQVSIKTSNIKAGATFAPREITAFSV
jgi:hypothetical protein